MHSCSCTMPAHSITKPKFTGVTSQRLLRLSERRSGSGGKMADLYILQCPSDGRGPLMLGAGGPPITQAKCISEAVCGQAGSQIITVFTS